jgi:hypothetical protein
LNAIRDRIEAGAKAKPATSSPLLILTRHFEAALAEILA